jgi:hypothetical protein
MAKRSNRPNHSSHKKNNSAGNGASLMERLGEDTALKMKRFIEDGIKRKIKSAQADPAVQAASQKFMKND